MPGDGVRSVKAANEAAIFARANVVGVAVGNKVIGGRETNEACIVVFVEAKRPEAQLRHRDIVPKALGGVRTDVVETGRFRALRATQTTNMDRTKRIRPAPGGVSVGHFQVTAGTLGVLARRSGRPVILSNNHVLANQNAARVGDPILQPGPADGGRLQDTIARLVDFVPIQFKEREPGPIARFLARLFGPLLRAAGWGLKRLPSGHSNLVDAAVAEPIETRLVAPDILGIGRVRGTKEPDIGMRVRKSGRTTGVTEGRITAIDAVVEVDYGGPTAIFREQIVSDLLSKGGDSGSLVVDEVRHAAHLLFAGPAGTGKTTSAIALARDMFGEDWRQNYFELNSSDERGIETVRTKVKEIARLAPFGGTNFKIIFLDEADNLTADAQAALRRTMETYSKTSRFILSANYSSRLIEPIRGGQGAHREGARGGIPPGPRGPRQATDRVRAVWRGHRPAAPPDRLRPEHPGRVQGPSARPDRGDGLPAHGGEQRADPDRVPPRALRPHRAGTEQEVIRTRGAVATTRRRPGPSATRRSSSRGPSRPDPPSP